MLRKTFPVLILAATAAPAAPQLKLSATHRTRYEMIAGQARTGFGERDDLLNFRTTVMADYTEGPITMAAELWDSRVVGEDRRTPVTSAEVNVVEPVQAYAIARLGVPFGKGSSATVQAGRFLLNLGSRRLVAADDYRNTTNGYTGVRADLAATGGWRGQLVWVMPQLRRPDTFEDLVRERVKLDRESPDLILWGGLVQRLKAIGAVSVEAGFFHLGERDAPGRPTRDRSLDTASLRLMRDPAAGKADFEMEAIGQTGHVSASVLPTAARLPVRAWFVHADAGYTFAGPARLRLSLDYDHASGDGPGRRFTRFDTLFGMRRADLAPAGLFNAIARANIQSAGVRAEAVAGTRTDGMLSVRPMWAASRTDSFAATGVRDASGRSGRFAGHLLDGRVRHRLTRNLLLEVDGVLLRKGRLLRDAPNAPPGRWTRYLSLNAVVSLS